MSFRSSNLDTRQDGTTYLQLFSSTSGSKKYATTQDSVHKQDTDNFFIVASLYGSLIKPGSQNDMNHYVGMGLKLYGAGGFSSAVRVSETGVAKLPRIAPGSDGFSEADFYRDLITELRICLHTPISTHENIITLQSMQWTAGPNISGTEKLDFMWPVLEFEAAGGTLIQLLRNHTPLPFSTKMNLRLDLAKALDCLHGCGIVHSDVKSENAFVFPHPPRGYIAKIADFGCSTILEDTEKRRRLSGYTKLWSAPERDKEMGYGEICRTDIYSFGLMVWQVITDGKTPFEWFSWMDSSELSHDDISALKDDNCILPLALEALAELPLARYEREICSEIFSGTLGSNEARVDYLSPLFESHWTSTKWGYRDLRLVRPGYKEFLGPIPSMNITGLVGKLALDHRVPTQIFDSIKRVLSSALDSGDEPTVAFLSYQLFLCYYHGFGTDRDLKAGMSALAEAARYGDPEAQEIVAQFHEAHGAEIPQSLPVCDWLEEQTLLHTMGAAGALESLDPMRHHQAVSKLKETVETDRGHCSFSLARFESLIANYTPGSRTLIEEIETNMKRETGLGLIHIAAASGNLQIVQGLLDNRLCDSNARTSSGETPLYFACRGGHREVTLLLLSRQPTHNDTLKLVVGKEIDDTWFHWLSSFDPSDMVEIATNLIRKKGAIAVPRLGYDTPLLRAISKNNIEAAKVLLGFGVQRTFFDLSTAASLRCSEILYLLMYDVTEKEGRLDQKELGLLIRVAASASTLLSIQLHGFKHSYAVISTFETLDYFIQLWYPHSPPEIEREKCQALQEAIYFRQLGLLQLVLDPFFKPCIASCSKEGVSVLNIPLCLGDTEIFSLFLENGAAKYGEYHTNKRGISVHSLDQVFTKAIRSANPFFIGKLLQQELWLDESKLYEATGGPTPSYTKGFFCPFQLAVLEACYDTATFLAKTTMQIETNQNCWSLFLAAVISAQENHGFTMLDYLLNLKEGPPPFPDREGMTVLHYLTLYWCVEPESRRGSLRRYWAKLMSRFQHLIDKPNHIGETPLEHAAAKHNVLMVEALIDAGAALNTLNNKGQTVLDTILIIRLGQVIRFNPRGPPLTPSETATTIKMEPVRITSSDTDITQTDVAKAINTINGSGRKYQGDSYDERLHKIYTMIREAGGTSTLFPEPFSCTENLENWTMMWVRINQAGFSRIEGEAREIFDRMVGIYGYCWRIASPDGCDSYVVVGGSKGSSTSR